MTTAYDFLKANPVFHLATVESGAPRVRPFGFVMARDGKLYFCTNKKKAVYAQLRAAPAIELSAMAQNVTWMRLRGTAVFDDTPAADSSFTVFFLTAATATLYGFGQPPQESPLL